MASNPATLNDKRYKKAALTLLLLASTGISGAAYAGGHTDDELEFNHGPHKPQPQEPVTQRPPPTEEELKKHCGSSPAVELCDFVEEGDPEPVPHPYILSHYQFNLGGQANLSVNMSHLDQEEVQQSLSTTDGTTLQVSAGGIFDGALTFGVTAGVEHSRTIQNAVSRVEGTSKGIDLPIPPGCWGILMMNVKSAQLVTGHYEATSDYAPPKNTHDQDWSRESIKKVKIHFEVPTIDKGNQWVPDFRAMTRTEIETIHKTHLPPDNWRKDPVKAYELHANLPGDQCRFDSKNAPDPDAAPTDNAPGSGPVTQTSASSVDEDSDPASVDEDSDSASVDEDSDPASVDEDSDPASVDDADSASVDEDSDPASVDEDSDSADESDSGAE